MCSSDLAEFFKLGFVADGPAVSGNDDRVVCRRREIGVGRCNHPVDAAAGRIVNERIDTVPIGIANMHDVGLGKGCGNIAVGVRGPVVLQADRRAIQLETVLACKTSLGIPPDRSGRKL